MVGFVFARVDRGKNPPMWCKTRFAKLWARERTKASGLRTDRPGLQHPVMEAKRLGERKPDLTDNQRIIWNLSLSSSGVPSSDGAPLLSCAHVA